VPVFLLPLLLGCGSTLKVQRSPRFDEQAPLRIAILPFEDRTGATVFTILAAPFKAVADLFVSRKGAPPTDNAQALREALAANLRTSTLDVVPLGHTDTVLVHNGLLAPGKEMRFVKADRRDLGRLLGADALLYGVLTDAGTAYYLAETRVTVGATLRLVDAGSGEELWRVEGEESQGFGITRGPTGYVSAAVEPLKGLRESNQWRVMEEFARTVAGSFHRRPANTDGPGSLVPFVAIAAANVEPEQRLSVGSVVRVVAIGRPGMHGRFDLGGARRGLPMREFGLGTYQGTYTVLEGDRFAGDPVRVILRNDEGREAQALIPRTRLTTAGG
jgi:hypothetical protein